MKGTWVALVLCASVAVVARASAEPTDRTAAAEDLFQRANALMGRKQYAQACPLLAESYRLDPAGGTLQNLAVCYEESGKWASAYARFQELRVVSMKAASPRLDRIQLAEVHILTLTSRLSRVLVVLASRPDGVEVKLDEVSYREASWSAGILVDPGSHALLVTAPDKTAFRTSFDVVGEGTREISVPQLMPTAKQRASTGSPTPPDAVGWWTPLRTTGVALAGVGATSVLTGLALGLVAKSNYDDARSQCRGSAPDSCPAAAVTSGESARSLATGGTVAIVAGGVVAALGGALIALSSPTPSGAKASGHPRAYAGLGMATSGSVGVVGEW